MHKTSWAALVALALIFSSMSPITATATEAPVQQCKLIGNNTPATSYRYEDSGHITNWSNMVQPIGLKRMLVIATDFEDVPAKTSLNKELSFMKEVKSFFSTNSQGLFQLEIDSSLGWVRLPKPASYYKKAEWTEKINDAIDIVDPKVDFSKYELVLFYISRDNLITTEAGALPDYKSRKPDGLPMLRGVYLGNDGWRQKGQHAGVTIHELMHVFGLPDLYMHNADGTKNVGVFDQMSEYLPRLGSRIFYWHRWKLGWLQDSQVTCLNPDVSQTIKINASNARNNLWVLPISERKVAVIQPWIVGREISAISYEVDAKSFVWTSEPIPGGKYSPIQMLRPKRAGPAPKAYVNRNLQVVFRNNDSIETDYASFQVRKRGNNLSISVEPR